MATSTIGSKKPSGSSTNISQTKNVALKSPKISLIKGYFGDLRATFLRPLLENYFSMSFWVSWGVLGHRGFTIVLRDRTMGSDILFPYRSPSPRPHPDPTQHPETEPKRSQTEPKRSQTEPNGAKTEPNGAEMDRNQAFRGGTGGGFVGVGGGGGL